MIVFFLLQEKAPTSSPRFCSICFFLLFETLFWEASTHNDAHTTPGPHVLRRSAYRHDCPSGDIATANTPSSLADAQDAIPGLLDDIVVTHFLSTDNFNDPADLARLPVVSHAMRDAVAAMGLRFEELSARAALNLRCFSALERLRRGGRLPRRWRDCDAAASSGQLEALQWLREDGCPWNENTCAMAAYGGHLEVLQWIRANGCPWDERTCYCAATEIGNLEVLQWAHANGCPWDEGTCSEAALHGNLEILQWLRANDCPWDVRTCQYAAKQGEFEVLQWARANGCPWNENTCLVAAVMGHLEVLQWLHANGCPWDTSTCWAAAKSGRLEVLQWAHSNSCP